MPLKNAPVLRNERDERVGKTLLAWLSEILTKWRNGKDTNAHSREQTVCSNLCPSGQEIR